MRQSKCCDAQNSLNARELLQGVRTFRYSARFLLRTYPRWHALSHLRSSMKCFLIRVQLPTLGQNSARLPDLPSWVARRVDLRSDQTRSIKSRACLFLCVRGTPCACGLLDDSAEPDRRNWQLKKQAGAALANVAHLLGTKMIPAGFTVVPICVNHLYRAAYPLPVQIIDLFRFIDCLIAGALSKEVQYCVRPNPNASVAGEGSLLRAQPIFEGRNTDPYELEYSMPVFARANANRIIHRQDHDSVFALPQSRIRRSADGQ
jgi:hypothetical protein